MSVSSNLNVIFFWANLIKDKYEICEGFCSIYTKIKKKNAKTYILWSQLILKCIARVWKTDVFSVLTYIQQALQIGKMNNACVPVFSSKQLLKLCTDFKQRHDTQSPTTYMTNFFKSNS